MHSSKVKYYYTLIGYIDCCGVKILQSNADCQGVNTSTISIRMRDSFICTLFNKFSLNISLKFKAGNINLRLKF